MTGPAPAKIIRRRNKHARREPPAPVLSCRPWAGFTARDMPREEPLPRCPSPRCRRARACIAAIDNLYCLRTHYSLHEQRRRNAGSSLQRELDSVPAVVDAGSLSARMVRIAELAVIRGSHDGEMLARWKSGVLDHLYGKYRQGGVVLKPPPRSYVELPVEGSQKKGGQSGHGRRIDPAAGPFRGHHVLPGTGD